MSRTYALIEDGVVVNTIIADSWHTGIDVTDYEVIPGPGWTYDGAEFHRPVVVEEEPVV
jgi:hypothetical protein